MLIEWICLCFWLFLCSRMLARIVVDSSLKIEEFFFKMEISLKSEWVIQNNYSSLAQWPDRVPSYHHLRRFLGILSIHLCIPESLPPFHCALWSVFGLLQKFLHSLTPPHFANCFPLCCSRRHNTRRHSLFMRVLSHSDTLTTSIGI